MEHMLREMTSPQVAEAIRSTPMAVVPVGSVEQHGPHLPCGTDIIAAETVASAVAEELDALCVPLGPYGVTPLHRGRPGTVSLRPSTFEALLREVCEELTRMGVEVIVLVNWHEGNTASLNRVATEVERDREAVFVVAQACYTAQRVYAAEGGELTHAGGIETLAVLAHDPQLVNLDAVDATPPSERGREVDEMRRSHEVYGFVSDVSELAPAGWYGDPGWASSERAETFSATLSGEIAERIRRVLAIKQRSQT